MSPRADSTSSSQRPTPVVHHQADFERSFSEIRRDRPVLILIDPQVSNLPFVDAILSTIPDHHQQIHFVNGDVDMDEVTELAILWEPNAVILGIGGGAVIDRAKLVSLLSSNPGLERILSPRHRSGFVLLPPGIERSTGLVIVPTTVGTGAEASRTTCLRVGETKKLVYANCLKPDLAYVTSAATESLPKYLLGEGVFEILMRVGSYYVGCSGDLELGMRGNADRLAEDLARELLALGAVVAECRRSDDRISALVRERIAVLSGYTHRSDFHEGLEPFSDKCWPLANELSMHMGIRKVTAMTAIAPALWRRIESGQLRWGSPQRLRRWWSVVSETVGLTSEFASAGIEDLIQLWDLERPEGEVDADELVDSTERSWAKGLPMLAGISSTEIHAVYSQVLTRP